MDKSTQRFVVTRMYAQVRDTLLCVMAFQPVEYKLNLTSEWKNKSYCKPKTDRCVRVMN